LGLSIGCIGQRRADAFQNKITVLDDARRQLAACRATPHECGAVGIAVKADGRRRTAMELLAFKEIDMMRLAALWPDLAALTPAVSAQLEIEAHYAVYLDRQQADIEAYRRDEALELSPDLDYGLVKGFSNEVREKLINHRPATLGAAARIPGITPAALTLLLAHVRRAKRRAVA
jgi:tRNA uridine 5-carboxymethylaminomethyl modification enzyme